MLCLSLFLNSRNFDYLSSYSHLKKANKGEGAFKVVIVKINHQNYSKGIVGVFPEINKWYYKFKYSLSSKSVSDSKTFELIDDGFYYYKK